MGRITDQQGGENDDGEKHFLAHSVVGNTIIVGMHVTEPADWVRVVTANAIAAAGAVLPGGIGTVVVGRMRRRRTL